MGWHDDFLNSAVRQDLGKSGIKIAETLEIQTAPTEWWRLISSASPATVRGYTGRSFPEPVIEGEEMNLSPLLLPEFSAQGSGSGTTTLGSEWHDATKEKISYTLLFEGDEKTPAIVTAYKVLRDSTYYNYYLSVYSLDGSVRHSFDPLVTNDLYTTAILDVFWDHVNQRIVFIYGRRTGVKTAGHGTLASATIFTSSTGLSTISTDFQGSRVFPECPGNIYSLFLGASVVVKKTIPTAGQSAGSVGASVLVATDGATVAVASNYRGKEAFLFYSRTLESVGLAWVDSTNGRLYYALESDDWDTAYILSSSFADRGETLAYFGNLALVGAEEAGEYYVAGTSAKKTGLIQRPMGYSYPLNLSMMGLTRCSSGNFRMFFRAGSTCYIYEVDRDTKQIITQTSIDLGFTIASQYLPVKIAESEERELFLLSRFEYIANPDFSTILINLDKASGEIVWVWGQVNTDWSKAGSPFPHLDPGSAGRNQAFVFRYKDELLLWGLQTNKKSEHIWVSVDSALECESAVAFKTLLLSQTAHYDSDIQSKITSSVMSYVPFATHPNSAITWGETIDTVFFVMRGCQLSDTLSTHFSKSTKKLVQSSWTNPGNTGGSRIFGGSILLPEYGGYSYNLSGLDGPSKEQGVKESDLSTTARYRLRVFPSTLWTAVSQDYLTSFSSDHKTHFVTSEKYGVTHVFIHKPGESTVYVVCLNRNQTSPSQGRLQKPVVFSHAVSRLLVDEIHDYAFFVSEISDGDISYTETKASDFDEVGGLVVKATDFGDTYSLNKGFSAIGGLQQQPLVSGSWIAYKDFANTTYIVETGAEITDFIGGEGGEGEAGEYIYAYSDYEFIPYPFAREGIRAELSNISKTTQVTLPETQDRMIQGLLAGGFDPRGSRCILRRIFPDHAEDEGGSIILLDGYIQEWTYSPDKQGIIFTVSKTLLDVNNVFPKRLMNMGCGHVFRGARCQYAGATGLCPKTKAFCTSLGNVNQFGGFPWVAARQRRVMWR